MRRRFFDVTIGYCPTCECNQFFAHTVGLSGTCPICKTFVLNIYALNKLASDRPALGESLEEGQDTIA